MKIVQFKCNSCNRLVEREVDPSRPYPVNCTITDKCTGKLVKVKEKSVRTELTEFSSTFRDQQQRGSTNVARAIESNPEESILSGSQTIALAVPASSLQSVILRFYAPFYQEVKKVEYQFRRGVGIQKVFGVDDTTGQKYLRCKKSDDITILVNGLLVSGFVVGTDEITFDSALTDELNIIKISVSEKVPRENISLTFSKRYDTESAWGNIKKVRIGGQIYDLFFCNEFSKFTYGKRYKLTLISAGQSDITGWYILNATPPFSWFSRITSTGIDLKKALDNDIGFLYTQVKDTSDSELAIEYDGVIGIFPPIELVEKDTNNEDFVASSAPSGTRKPNLSILGPS